MVLFSISLFTLATLSQNQIDPSYKVYLGGLAAEPVPADTKTLHKAANLLTSGQTKVLIQWATNKDDKKAYAARLIFLVLERPPIYQRS